MVTNINEYLQSLRIILVIVKDIYCTIINNSVEVNKVQYGNLFENIYS